MELKIKMEQFLIKEKQINNIFGITLNTILSWIHHINHAKNSIKLRLNIIKVLLYII